MRSLSALSLLALTAVVMSCSTESAITDVGSGSDSSSNIGPKAAISTSLDEPSSTPAIPISVVFTESVTGFEASDVALSHGSISNFSGSGTTYTFTVNVASGDPVTIQIPSGAVTGSSGRSNLAVVQIVVGFVPAADTAVLSGLPSALSNQSALNVAVSGDEVISYKYKVGEASSVNCSDASGYSSAINSSVAITNDISGLSDGNLRLCVLGASASSEQELNEATSHQWIKDTTTPTITGLVDAASWVKSKTWAWGCSETCTYSYVIDTNTSSVPSSSYTSATSASQTSGTGQYYLHIKAKDSAGNESSTLHISANIDNVAPPAPAAVTHDPFFASSTQSPVLSWGSSTDAQSGAVASFEYALGSTAGASDIIDWTLRANTSVQVEDLSLTNGETYYVAVRAIDSAGNRSAAIVSDGWQVDLTAPSAISNFVDTAGNGTLSVSPTLTWSAATDSGSGISHYELAIGTTDGGTETLSWKNIGNILSHQESGLSLVADTTYYASLRAVDEVGNTGAVSTTAGWSVSAPADVPCVDTFVAGQECEGGTIYVGMTGGKHYATTPGGCTDSANPTCLGNDSLVKTIDDATAYCSSLNFGGYSDWFLPLDTVLAVFYANIASLPGLVADDSVYYWTSMYYAYYGGATQVTKRFSDNEAGWEALPSSATHLVRCAREHQPYPETPDAFDFTDLTDTLSSTYVESSIKRITGLGVPVDVSISGHSSAQYRICTNSNCAANSGWKSTTSQITNDQYLQLRVQTSGYETLHSVTVNVGQVSDQWSATTAKGIANPCGSSPTAGDTCAGGIVYVSLGSDSKHYMTTPSGCTNSSTPTCTGTDALKKTHTAAKYYCSTLSYNGYEDWFLPSRAELDLMYSKRAFLTGLKSGTADYYWSTDLSSGSTFYYALRIYSGSYGSQLGDSNSHFVRCFRRANASE